MTSKSALQHRSCQSASLTDQSCCADNSLTAGMFHCKFTCESLLLTQRHYDQQECTGTDHGKVRPSLIRAVVQNRAEVR